MPLYFFRIIEAFAKMRELSRTILYAVAILIIDLTNAICWTINSIGD